jgi:hypothetical protein
VQAPVRQLLQVGHALRVCGSVMLNPTLLTHLTPPSIACLGARRSITGFTDHCTSYVLLAAYGEGAGEVEKVPVMRGAQWSCSKLLEQPLCLCCRATTREEEAALPEDFQVRRTALLHCCTTSHSMRWPHLVVHAWWCVTFVGAGVVLCWWLALLPVHPHCHGP